MTTTAFSTSFTVAGLTRTFEVLYSNDQRTAIAALSTAGITDPTLLAAANGALAQFIAASRVIDSIDAAVQIAVRRDGPAVMSRIYGDSPVYNSFQVNGAGILAHENQYLDHGPATKVMVAFNDATAQLWRDAIAPFLAESRNGTHLLPLRLASFTAAIAAASPSDSLTAASALLAAMGPISDAIMGAGDSDPFSLLTRDRVLPFALPVLPNLQVT